MHRRGSKPARRGFTLLELLVAVSLGAMLLLLTARVFGAATRGRERLQGRATELAALRRAYEMVTRDLHSATVPPDDSGFQFGLTATPAGAGSNVLQFAAVVGEPLLAGRAATETALIQYAITEDPRTGRPTLWRYETPYPVPEGTDPATSAETRALPLLAGVTGATYLFYSSEQQTWQETWDGQAGLPAAMRIDLAFQDSEGRPQEQPVSWTVSLPAAVYAQDEAAEAAAAGEETPQ